MESRRSVERLYGYPAPLPQDQLPTLGDVLRCCQLIKNEHKETNETKHEIDVRWMADIVACEVINVYIKASVTTITFEGIIKKVINSWKLVRTQLETVQPSRRNKPFYTARLQAFQQIV